MPEETSEPREEILREQALADSKNRPKQQAQIDAEQARAAKRKASPKNRD